MAGSSNQDADQAPAPVIEAGTGEAAFKKFDAYPWAKDRSFLQGLMATLGTSLFNKNNKDGFTRQKALSTALQARIWWYKSRFNIAIDHPAYEAYCNAHPSTSPDGSILAKLEEIQQRMTSTGTGGNGSSTAAAPATNIPEWQLNAPKVDLSVKAEDGTPHTHSGGGAPYPENFQALVDAVTSGKPIPGIKEIPDTVVRPPGVTPIGKMKAPRKPWEKADAEATAQPSVFGNVLDEEFPPLEPKDKDEDDGNGNGGGAPPASGGRT
ncbi:hypothetical protein C8A05DRAFT_43726 [Staphylotrichum tortipilum]|uniref:Uncharacterized protein n=1 Tax=Staphylotrichum tortipilum TaxID=2831512 RepID=A0AAN6RU85_9PEZI|nr:hypothetical protein C8A05DRAFT_43726 [Staphylotrichum longicolle]